MTCVSPALTEAELMARVLPPAEFADWLAMFLPGLEWGRPATLFTPAVAGPIPRRMRSRTRSRAASCTA